MQATEYKGISRSAFLRQCRKHLPFYLFLLLPIIQVILFNYLPIYGIQIAFKDFKMRRGILGSDWVGLKHFEKMFADPTFYRVLGNTLRLSILNMLTIFPLTIVFALMMNEVSHARFKRVTQTITYLPHFLSWVVIGGFVYQILSPSHGFINALLVRLGLIEKPIYFMIQKQMFISGRYGPAASSHAASPSPSPTKKKAHPLPNPSLTAASEPPVLAHQSAATPPQTCPNCGTTGMVRRYRDRWRCEWCHTIISGSD